MKQPLQIIHIEDSIGDYELVMNLLQSEGLACNIQRVETREQLVNALKQSRCDLILSDCTLPQFHGLEALEVARTLEPEIPFIFVSGTIGEETAIKSLQNGATDYVLKQRLSRLLPAVQRALKEAEGRRARLTMESQLRQARKLETIGTLAGGLAHDFRNLLQVLKMGIAMLPLKADDPEAVNQIAGQLDRATDRGCNLMNELLVFARKTDAHLVPVNMAALIGEIMQLLRPTLPGSINLSLHLEENLPDISADSSQLDRILTNLIMNARDALPNGGTLTVSSDVIRFDQSRANPWLLKDSPYLRVMISDTGSGMDEATQTRIFEPFFTTKPLGKGTGLGLSVVFGLMEAHHGFIDLESEVGKGTTFSLFFPLPEKEGKAVSERIHLISPTRLLGKLTQSNASAE
jgi:two-component system cell cycle sensor histidine kinase/response regulator CckA